MAQEKVKQVCLTINAWNEKGYISEDISTALHLLLDTGWYYFMNENYKNWICLIILDEKEFVVV